MNEHPNRLTGSPPLTADYYNSLGLFFASRQKHREAIQTFEKALDLNPGHGEAFYNQALSLTALGRLDEAIEGYTNALRVKPDFADACYNLGNVLKKKGRIEKAVQLYLAAIQLKPDFTKAYNNLGLCWKALERFETAVKCYQKAIALKPDYAEAHNNLGLTLQAQGLWEQAIEKFKTAISFNPGDSSAHYNLGFALYEIGNLDAAADHYRRSIQLKPDFADAHNNMGAILKRQGRPEEAIAHYRAALECNPGRAEIYNNLGNALKKCGRIAEAIEMLRQALAERQDYAEAYNNLGIAQQSIGKYTAALNSYAKALELDPEFAEARFNRATVDLLLGNFSRGWQGYEWRLKMKGWQNGYPLRHDLPLWDGSPFPQKRLLVHGEQGFGDIIQFVRYLPQVKALGGTVILATRKPLVACLQGVEGVDEVVDRSAVGDPVVGCDLAVPLLSLPGIFKTNLPSIPAQTPYLYADAAKVSCWEKRIQGGEFKVGLVWGGNPEQENDHLRSIPFRQLITLADIAGLRLFALQKGPAAGQLGELPAGVELIDLSSELEDFSDTAAAMANMDLIISVCTAPAHLAGALGLPVWTLLGYAPDWRWMLNRQDSPWYPTMRLFRQTKCDDWQGVVRRVKSELEKMVQKNCLTAFPFPNNSADVKWPNLKKNDGFDLDSKLSRAIGLHRDGNLHRAARTYQEILDRHPDNADTIHLAGLLAYQKGEYKNAVALITRAIHIFSHNSGYHNSLGLARQALGESEKAIACYRRAIAIDSRYAEAHYNLGVVMHQQNKLDEALGCFQKALEGRPDLCEAYESIGIVYQARGEYEKAAASFRKAIELRPRDTELYRHLGRGLENLGKLDEAVDCYRRILAIEPHNARAYNDMGLVFRDQGYLDDALATLQKAVAIDPRYAEAHHNLGTLLQDQGRLEAACQCYRQALAVQPDFAKAYNNLGMAHQDMGNPQEAVACFRKAMDIQPDYAAAQRHLVHQLQKDCSWPELQAVGARLDRLTKVSLEAGLRPAEDPFLNLTRYADPAENLAVARAWSDDSCRRMAGGKAGFLFDQRRYRYRAITVGYLSCDFHDHPTAHLMLSLFGLHNREKFKINCYSYGPDDRSRYRNQIKNESDQFIDIRDYSHLDAAKRIFADEVDILVDLKGHTKGTRLDILACRPAPVQVHFLGFPGTTGADFIDYFITDRVVTPKDHTPYYSEKLVFLPHSYQVNDHQQEIAPGKWNRAELGLPAKGFVFSSFNLSYKIDPMMFDCWMRILQQVPGSVLWLFGDNQNASCNLRKEAKSRGVEPARLVFAQRLQKSEHLARLQWADLALDTRIVNGHTTTSDALWSGVPVITLQGNHFASRVSSSLLHATGLSELVTYRLEEYAKLAVRLATRPSELMAVRHSLGLNRLNTPLFDTARFVKNLEQAYGEMWQIFQQESKPRQFEVTEQTCGNSQENEPEPNTCSHGNQKDQVDHILKAVVKGKRGDAAVI